MNASLSRQATWYFPTRRALVILSDPKNVEAARVFIPLQEHQRVPGENLASYPMLFLSPDVALTLSEVWFCPCEVKRVCQLSLNHILN